MSNAYSFQDFVATLVGPTGSCNLGYGAAVAEEGIDFTQNNEVNTMTIGSDGKGMHSLHADKSGRVTVRLLKTSPTNQVLMAMYDAQRISASLWGQNVIVGRQIVAGDTVTALSCAFKKPPDLKYAQEGGLVEWEWDTIEIDRILGTY